MIEERIDFSVKKDVFYNPAMTTCRSISSLAVGAIGSDLEVVDAFCASGIRGIRYAKENPNVQSITFLDIEKGATSLARKNAKRNGLSGKAKTGNISRLAFDLSADFLEIDPFGTPSPYLVDAFRFFNPKKAAFLSITATDVAVLCGGKVAPCMKNYHSKPLNNEFTHETGIRILIKRIVEVASEFNMGLSPLLSLSDRHYLKVIVHVQRGAELAYDSLKKLGYISYDGITGSRSYGQFPDGGKEFAGPLWLGELHDAGSLKRMKSLNDSRQYSGREEISRILSYMENEIGMPPFYYNLHQMCKKAGTGKLPKTSQVIENLRKAGFRAGRTHFCDVSIKTDAPHEKILEAMEWKG